MLIAVIISASLLVLLAVVHALAAKYFSVCIVNGKRPVDRDFQPHATVLLSIRGCDPSLEKNLVGLLQQDYENYQIIAVVDHQSDEAWATTHHVKSEFDTENRLQIVELAEPRNSCSLKCSALVQAIESLSDDVEVVILVDADVVPHREWLLQATSPLADPYVGVVTGNQWFESSKPSTGSLLRSLWNAGALVPTAALANPWAGTCAMRLADVRKSGLLDTWKESIVDDGPIRKAFEPLQKQIVFNPELIMVNRENCTVDYVDKYVPRMLRWSRMFEKTFVNTFVHMLLLVGSLLVTLGISIAALFTANWLCLAIGVPALLLNIIFNVVGYITVRSGIRRIESRRDEIKHQHYLAFLSPGRILKLACLIPVCQVGFGIWTIKSIFLRRVAWRQITYEIKGRNDVRMIEYQPINNNIQAGASASEVSI